MDMDGLGSSPVLLEKKHLLDQRKGTPSSGSPTRGLVNVWAEFGIHDEIVAFYDCSYDRDGKLKRRLSSSAAYEGRLFLGVEHLCFLSHSVGKVVRVCVGLCDVAALETVGSAALSIRCVDGPQHVFYLGKLRSEVVRELQQLWTYCRLEKLHGKQLRDDLRSVEETINAVLLRLRKERLTVGELRKWERLLQGKLGLPFSESLIERYACMLEESKALVAAGVLLLTQSFVCFTGTVPFSATPMRSVIPLIDVTSIDKRGGGLIVIFTHNRKYTFSSFNERKSVVALLKKLWANCLPQSDCIDDASRPTPQPIQQSNATSSILSQTSVHSPKRKRLEFMSSLGVTADDLLPDVNVDRYGFTVPSHLWYAYQASQPKYEKSLQKQKTAWSIFIANNDIDKLIQLHAAVVLKVVRKGIPFQRRGELWYTFSGAQLKKKRSSSSFEELKTKLSVYSKDIAKDIRRTFPHHPFYRKEENIKMLERVLVAYSNRNPAIGYCQSMNFIAAMLLLFLPEDRAFWVLATIVEDRLQEYFSESMIGTLVDQKVLVELMNDKMPRLASHCRKQGLPIEVGTTKWFMCLFVGTLPTETTLRVWDCFFFQGSPIIISVALAILKLHEEELLKVASCDKFMEVSSSIGKACFDADKLMKVALDTVGVMDIKHLNHVRMRFWTDTENKLLEENKKRDMYVLQRSTAFSEEQLERWHRAFTQGELQSSGTYTDCTPRAGPAGGVEREAFVELLVTINANFASNEAAPLVDALFAKLDVNHDLCIKFKDFLLAANTICNGTMEEKVKLFYDAKAENKSLSRQEALDLIRELQAVFMPQLYDSTCDIEQEHIDEQDMVQIVCMQPQLACALSSPILESLPTATLRASDEVKPARDLAASPVHRSTPPLQDQSESIASDM